MKRLTVNVQTMEVEKPSGGGRGPDVPYTVDVVIDGQLALRLTRGNFKQPGQMDAFVEILENSTEQ